MDLLNNRRTPLIIALVLGLSLGAAGCNEQGEKTSESKDQKGEVLATVNGEPITEDELNEYRSARPASARMQDEKALLDELVTQKVVYQDALSKNLDKDPEVALELELLRIRALASAAVQKAMKDNPITDEELRAEYDKLKERMVTKEYKAGHILVKEEELAKKLIAQLNQGADFAKLAQEHSTDSSAQAGGDLGWFNPKQMVPPFSQALGKIEPGSYTKDPVKTQFGWHVIKLEDSRQSEPPALEEIKGRLEQMLKQRQVGDYIQALKDKAEITIKGEEEAPVTEISGEAEVEKSSEAEVEKEDSAEGEKADTPSTK
jgi:peptidyl-prolyl cis-trans isomerase C